MLHLCDRPKHSPLPPPTHRACTRLACLDCVLIIVLDFLMEPTMARSIAHILLHNFEGGQNPYLGLNLKINHNNGWYISWLLIV